MTLKSLMCKLEAKAIRGPSDCLTVGANSPRRYWSVIYDGKRRNAHQAAWEFHKGPIPVGLCVCHTCDNPRCINPAHLFLGTMADNIHDRDLKGRNGTTGENARTAKLTESQALEIHFSSQPDRELASKFSVSLSTIKRIKAGRSWRTAIRNHS